jgi:CheY-like chemotaxis protein
MTAPKRRILVVDDDTDVLRALTTTLTQAGYDVVLASNGAEAVRRWREINGGNLVLLDMFMPEKDGLETIIELRTYSPDVPIIAMSGGGTMGRVDILADAKLLGAVHTLEKPFSTHTLLALVAQAVDASL